MNEFVTKQLTEQSRLVLERMRQLYGDINIVNDRLASRANTVLASSAALMAFVTAGEFLGVEGLLLRSVVSILSLLAGIVVMICALGMYRPRDGKLAGSIQWDEWVTDYLDVSVATTVDQLLSDNLKALQRKVSDNATMALKVRYMLLVFCVQTTCVGAAVAVNALIP